jgi:hypothetical protein
VFHSLDYQSATDLLDPYLSGVCVDAICDAVGMPDDLRVLFHKALTGHLIEGVPQVRGQLMGSIVSFLVLCLINMSVIRAAYELTLNTRVSLEEIPAVVNGDDGLVRAPARFSDLWDDAARVAGLTPSVGKVYTDSQYVNINSTSFLFEDGSFRHIPYVNMGLVKGLGRSGTGKVGLGNVSTGYENPYESSMGARHHSLMESCPSDLRLEVHEMFLKENKQTLKLSGLPWYVPESLGGVGLKPLVKYTYGDGDIDSFTRSYEVTSTGHVCGPSRLDAQLALTLREGRFSEFSVKKIPSSQPIRARPVWQTGLSLINKRGRRVVMSQEDETFMDLSTYYLTPSLVAQQLDSSTQGEVARRNRRAWESLLALMDDYSSEGESLFIESDVDVRSAKVRGVKPYRLVGADSITHRPLYSGSGYKSSGLPVSSSDEGRAEE